MRAARRSAHDEGQASLEWLAVVAVVAALLAVGVGAALAQAPFLERRVTREMARALCLVGHGDCARDQEPCVIGSGRRRVGATLDLFVVRLGGGRAVLVEERSDGTWAVTRSTERAFGLHGEAGAKVSGSIGGQSLSLGATVSASEVLTREGGSTWIAGSREEALALLADPGRPADIESGGVDVASSVGVSIGLTGPGDLELATAGAEVTFDRRQGRRHDRRTGRTTIYVRSSREATLTVGGAVLGTAGAGGEVYAVELDAGGRPVDLQVTATGALGGSRDLPAVVQPVAGMVGAAAGDRVYEVTAHLDLTDSANLAAARELLGAITARGVRVSQAPEASQALRRRIDARGTVEVRVLEQREASSGASGSVTLGRLTVGGALDAQALTTRLLAAQSRGLDGRWLAREDCVAAA